MHCRMVGGVSIDSTEYTLPIAASSITSLGSAALAIVVWAWLFPVKFDWDELKTINQNMDEELETGESLVSECETAKGAAQS